MELRRIMNKDPEIHTMAQGLIIFYNDLDNQSLFDNITQQDEEENIEWEDITNWKREAHGNPNDNTSNITTGPIMFLLNEINKYNFTIDHKFNLKKINEPTINIWLMPCQQLKTALHDIVRQKRDADIAKNRTYLEEFWEMDH
jgi:hypothetical protein